MIGSSGPRRRSSRRTDAAVSDDALLDAAVAELARDPEATADRIARRAGTDARSLRHRFRSRDALLEAAVMRGARRIAHAAVLEDGNPPEQVALLVARLWDDQSPVATITALWLRSHLRPDVEAALDPVRELLAEAIGRGAATHGMRMDLPETTIAWLVEHAVLACLVGVADGAVSVEDGRHLAITHALGATGLDWHEAGRIADGVDARMGRR